MGVNRKAQYEGADVFAICCAANQRTSMESIAKWKAEIQEKEPTKPIALLQTKRDLVEIIDDESMLVTKGELQQKKKDFGLVLFASTSSKEWSDFNVHKAFNNVINAGYKFKYE